MAAVYRVAHFKTEICIYMYFLYFYFFFFFSSRRRHTRCLSDWSSDVCSSDLGILLREEPGQIPAVCIGGPAGQPAGQIGRASCRERVEIWGVAGSLKKKKETQKKKNGIN